MRKFLLALCVLLTVVCANGFGDYQLAWSDEFDGPNIDTSNWNFETGGYWHNNEIQFYTDRPENARIENGNLVIEAREEVYENRNHTSARMTTQYKQSFMYGRMEARIKLPAGGNGMWPAFWMLGDNFSSVGWPESGEIDILEAVNDFTEVVGAVHYGTENPYDHQYNSLGYDPGLDVSEDYHTYAIEWEPTEIRWYFDDVNFFTESYWFNSDPYPAPFNQPFFFLLNIAVGGDWPGYPDDTTPFPQTMYVDWVRVYQENNVEPTVDIGDLISNMTLDEKVGQMTQAERSSATPDDVRDYFLGSILSGGGSHPASNTPTGWADMHDDYQIAAMNTSLGIPILYGIDAVHGHSNVVGATIFPHNIGLGAARDPDLVEDIGRITAKEVRCTGLEWTFSPCVAVVRDERWGRTYEGFGEHPELATLLAGRYVEGLQGTTMSGEKIIACAKHYVGDGGTTGGDDQGNTICTEQQLRDIHMPGYTEAIAENVGTIMPSYSSWNGLKMHENGYLLTDVLKTEFGFDGFLISDWHAVDQLSGATFYDDVVLAVNAGVDMGMQPNNWRDWITAVMDAVIEGDIPMSRIDDAVRRILTIKQDAGLLNSLPTNPADVLADRTLVNSGALGSQGHREIARKAVRKSLVLLKNNGVLPLSKGADVFVAGKNAYNIGNQCGGWTISWQGASGAITPGTTILEGIQQEVIEGGGSVTFNESGNGAAGHDVAIVVIGETPYAEGNGDDTDLALDSTDINCMNNVASSGIPMLVVLVSGRPMIVTDYIGDWDAFVAAWLPGTEGDGVAEVLFGDYDFTGKLPHTWPVNIAQVPINVGDSLYDPLFPYGYGLDYSSFPPTVSITNPSDGATLPTGDIVIDAVASDSNGSVITVEFYEGSNFLGEDTTSPYSMTWTSTSNGTFTITAKAIDNTGLSSTDSISLSVGTGTSDQFPYYETPFVLPARIEAEDYDLGGEGAAYHDTTGGNDGGWYRSENVDIENCSEGGYNVGWMAYGEWLEYTVDVPAAGEYTIDIRVASQWSGGNFHLEFDGIDVTGNMNVPETGGWQNWTTVSRTVVLSAGTQIMRFVNANSNDEYNINYFEIVPNFDVDAPYINVPFEFTWIAGQPVTDCLTAGNGQEPYHNWLATPLPDGLDWSVLDSNLFVPGVGLRQYWQADDATWNYTLPFTFPYYGTNYYSVNICSNGFIDFESTSANYSNSTSELIQNVRIAPLWDDLVTYEGDIFIDESVPGQVTIRWRGETWSDGSPVRFAVVLFDDGTIRFDYGGYNTSLSPTVGISAGNGSDYIIVPGYDGANILTYANSVLFTPVQGELALPPGVILDPITGCFEGIPETEGYYSAIVEVTDSSESQKTGQRRFDFEVIECRPSSPIEPVPYDGEVDVPIDTMLSWTVECDATCGVENGGFEAGDFSSWATVTGLGEQFFPWTIWDALNGFPLEGNYHAICGLEGDAGLFYDLYQEVVIPSCAATAVFDWSEYLAWEIGPGTLPREYTVSIQPAGGGEPLAILFSQQLHPNTVGGAGYVPHSVDLLELAPAIAGQTIRINFHTYIPESWTGPAYLLLDGISLTCGAEVLIATPQEAASDQETAIDTAAIEALMDGYESIRQQALDTTQQTTSETAAVRQNSNVDSDANIGVQNNSDGFNGDTSVTYDVYFGIDESEMVLIGTDLNTMECDPSPELDEVLLKGRVYYWQVVAKNVCGEVAGPVWSFRTENTPPVADAGDDQTVFCWIDGLVNVTLDGSDSYDGDENPITYLWTWTVDSQSYSSTEVSPTITLPVGIHTITLVVNDGIEDSELDEVVITAEPPIEVSVKCTPRSLNCESKGHWIKAHFIMTENYQIADVNINAPCTLEPLGLLAKNNSVFINEDGLVQIDVSFDQDELCETDPLPGFIQLISTGSLTSGHYFYGIDEIRILDNKMEHLLALATNWLEEGCGKPDWCDGQDANMDTVVDLRDFALIQ